MEQRTPEWFEARLGKVTASRVADATARTKTGWGTSRANYMAQLVAERLTGSPAASYSNSAMEWGTEQEPNAKAAYSFDTGNSIEDVGFVDHPRIDLSGASPDGRVLANGLVEIKCPNTATHIDTLLGSKVQDKYIKQMQWQMACDQRGWCDFVSYDPRMPIDLQLKIIRFERDDALIATLEEQIEEFLAEVDIKVKKLLELTE